jgi:hypothetical protein
MNLLDGKADNSTIEANLFGNDVERKRFLKKIWVRLPFKPLLRFILFYILRLGFLDGKAGYTYGRLLSQYEFQIGLKLYELRQMGGQLNNQASLSANDKLRSNATNTTGSTSAGTGSVPAASNASAT